MMGHLCCRFLQSHPSTCPLSFSGRILLSRTVNKPIFNSCLHFSFSLTLHPITPSSSSCCQSPAIPSKDYTSYCDDPVCLSPGKPTTKPQFECTACLLSAACMDATVSSQMQWFLSQICSGFLPLLFSFQRAELTRIYTNIKKWLSFTSHQRIV